MSDILLVEDDQYYREALKQLLEHSNYTVDEAFDGQDGLDKMQQTQYALVISDIMHPHLDGLQMVERFRSLGKEQGTIWYLSNLAANKEIMKEASDLGVNKLFAKSLITPNQIVSEVNTFFEKQSQEASPQEQEQLLGEPDMLKYLTQFDHIKLVPEKRYLFIITDDNRRKDYASAYIDTRADITNSLEEGIRMMNPDVYKLIYSDQEIQQLADYSFWEQRDFIYIYESHEYGELRTKRETEAKSGDQSSSQNGEKKNVVSSFIDMFRLP